MHSKSIKVVYQNDELALENMIHEVYPKIHSYIYYRLLDESIARDLTQETFYHFFNHIDHYEEQGKLLNYLYQIALHLIYDYGKEKQRLHVELKEEFVGDFKYDGHEQFQNKEEKVMLRKWVIELPEHLQDVVILRYKEGLKYKDISIITGVHVSTLKSQVALAISMLQKRARQEGWL